MPIVREMTSTATINTYALFAADLGLDGTTSALIALQQANLPSEEIIEWINAQVEESTVLVHRLRAGDFQERVYVARALLGALRDRLIVLTDKGSGAADPGK